MQMFELGVAYRGSAEPEVKQLVEASSMREAIRKIIEQCGGKEVALVTYAQYCETLQPRQPLFEQRDASFMLAPNPAA